MEVVGVDLLGNGCLWFAGYVSCADFRQDVPIVVIGVGDRLRKDAVYGLGCADETVETIIGVGSDGYDCSFCFRLREAISGRVIGIGCCFSRRLGDRGETI